MVLLTSLRPSPRSGLGLLGQVAFDLNWQTGWYFCSAAHSTYSPVSICRTPGTVLIGEEASPLPLNRPTPQGSNPRLGTCTVAASVRAARQHSLARPPIRPARSQVGCAQSSTTLFLLFAVHNHQARPSPPSTNLSQGSAARFCLASPCVKAAWVLLTPRPAARLDTQSFTRC